MGILFNKKGISPLFATLILISFSVAVGALLMNWTSPEANASCNTVNVELHKIADIPSLCLDRGEKTLKFVVKNTGQKNIDFLLVRIVDQDLNVQEFRQEFVLEPGRSVSRSIKLKENPQLLSAEIIPGFYYGQEEFFCSENSISLESVPDCPKK